MQSRAATVEEYLAELPEDRRLAVEAVRAIILQNLDVGYEEGMQYGMIGYYVPHRIYPAGYHVDPRQPLPLACLASQKNHLSLYMMSVYGDEELGAWFREAWAKTGKKLDMGKSCLRFRRAEDAALDVIGEAIRRLPVPKYIALVEATLAASGASRSQKQPSRKTAPAKKKTVSATKKAAKKSARSTPSAAKTPRGRATGPA